MSAEMPEHWVPEAFDGVESGWVRVPSGVKSYAEAYARKHAERVEAELAVLRAAARLFYATRGALAAARMESHGPSEAQAKHWRADAALAALLPEKPK